MDNFAIRYIYIYICSYYIEYIPSYFFVEMQTTVNWQNSPWFGSFFVVVKN